MKAAELTKSMFEIQSVLGLEEAVYREREWGVISQRPNADLLIN